MRSKTTTHYDPIDYSKVISYYGRSMNNKNQKTKKRLILTLTVIGILLAVGVVAGLIFRDTIKTVATDIQTNIENQGKPKFVFDTEKFPDWATNGNVYTDPDSITDYGGGDKDNVSVSGINIGQCKTGSSCGRLVEKCDPHDKNNTYCKQLADDTENTPCSVSAYYSEKNIDPSVAVGNELEKWSQFGTTPTEVSVKTLIMQTFDGEKDYQFYQYDTNNKDATYKRGSAFGFISLNKGHVEVRGVCWRADQLDTTLPILSSVRLER